MKRIHTFLAALLFALPVAAVGAVVTYPGPSYIDDTGVKRTPTSVTIASITTKAGVAIAGATATGNIATSNSSVDYDAAAYGEAWITLTPVLSGSTFANNPPVIYCSADPQTLAAAKTALPTAAPGASGGLLTYGTGAGQLNPVNGVLPGLTTALTGTATAATTTSITLAAGPAATDLIKGNYVAITGGTGAGQGRTITGWNGGTLVASISATRPWIVTPDATSTYAVVVNPHPVLDANLAVTTGTLTDKTNITLATGQNVATVAGQAPPTNWSLANIDGSGRGLLQPSQPGVTIPTVTTLTNPVVASSVTGSVGSITGITFPANFGTFSIDGSGRVTLVPGQSTTASNFVVAPAVAVDGSGRVLLQPTQTGVTIPTVTTITNPVIASSVTGAVGSVTAGVQVASYVGGASPDALVWNASAAAYNTASSMGAKLNASGTAADPWTAPVPGAYGAGTAGYRQGHMLTDASAPSWYVAATDPFANLSNAYGTAGTLGYFLTHTVSTYGGGDTPGTTTLVARPAPPTALQIAAVYDAETIDGGLTRKQEDALRYSIDHRLYKSNKSASTSVVTTRYYAPDGVTLYATSVYTPQAGTTDATRTWTYAGALTSL